jgi:hypothetical protein
MAGITRMPSAEIWSLFPNSKGRNLFPFVGYNYGLLVNICYYFNLFGPFIRILDSVGLANSKLSKERKKGNNAKNSAYGKRRSPGGHGEPGHGSD